MSIKKVVITALLCGGMLLSSNNVMAKGIEENIANLSKKVNSLEEGLKNSNILLNNSNNEIKEKEETLKGIKLVKDLTDKNGEYTAILNIFLSNALNKNNSEFNISLSPNLVSKMEEDLIKKGLNLLKDKNPLISNSLDFFEVIKGSDKVIKDEEGLLKSFKDRNLKLKEEVKNAEKELNKVKEDLKTSKEFFYPTKGYVTCPFGYRFNPFGGGRYEFHAGLDIAGGGNVYATQVGKVIKASYGENGGAGNCIVIDHGYYKGVHLVTKYFHLSKINVSVGQEITKGQLIGIQGTTGRSTGVHLHFQVEENGKPVDPLKYLNK